MMVGLHQSVVSTATVMPAHREKNRVGENRAYGSLHETEASGFGAVSSVVTILLTNRECPWQCVFCDLWKNTLDETVPAGAIPQQIRVALASLPDAQWIKLYNAGSFFDPRAIPPGDMPEIAELVAGFERVIVESHPALIRGGDTSPVIQFRDLLRKRSIATSTVSSRQVAAAYTDRGQHAQLEIAMGLETVHQASLERLNKGMTLDDFARAADVLRAAEIDLRAFVLVQPPFTPPEEAVEWALRSLDFARDQGARLVAFIPTRGGNGVMEALAASGDFTPPRLATLEEVLDRALANVSSARAPVVVADLWDLERFSDCPVCFPARAARLRRMNLSQQIEPRVTCDCDPSRAARGIRA